ncbi:MAG: LysR family transcriptional regulator substrate-binding protein [Bifidobacterium catenulatum]
MAGTMASTQAEDMLARDRSGMPAIVPQGVLARRDLSGWFDRNAKSLDIVGTMNLMYNASCFVQEGYGCAIGLAGLVNTSPDSELTFRPLDPPMNTQLAIAWKKNQPLTPAANAFLDALREIVQPRGDSEA